MAYLETLPAKGTQVIVAAAGMAAHLAGVVAAHSQLPVLGLPIAAGHFQASMRFFQLFRCLAVYQSRPWVSAQPVLKNAAYAARIIGLNDEKVRAL